MVDDWYTYTSSAHLPPSGNISGRPPRPSNSAYLVAQFESLGVEVQQVRSTDAGVAAVIDASEPFDAVVSDMGRYEPAGYRAEAGLDLMHKLRQP